MKNIIDLTKELDNCSNSFVPFAALIAYKSNYTRQSYVEYRKIVDGTMLAGKPLAKKDAAAILKVYSDDSVDQAIPYGMIPENLLYCDIAKSHYVWFNPPRQRIMNFDKNIKKKGNLVDGTYNMPGIIYCTIDKTLYVFAFSGKKPKMNSKLFFGPFHNMYNDGRICLGNAKATMNKNHTWENILLYWENLFWNSINQTVLSWNGKLKIEEILHLFHEKEADIKMLPPSVYTVKDLIAK